ncbi:hypothetical protein N7495_009362 [Penicillium taxi]|uniref:uncharacterized protein n=1 Tax=Penicillium taxi TaxID=168475 RepID=UPI002544E4FE|nr:uncharacterized protein N7495_009362 [Penicillium taxi]KAJ5884852.1 hypothetical protein N7495_009362 [Penicillium taxi]
MARPNTPPEMLELETAEINEFMTSDNWSYLTDPYIWHQDLLQFLVGMDSAPHFDCITLPINRGRGFETPGEYVPPENDGMLFGNLSPLCNDVLFRIFDELDPVSYHEIRRTCRRARSVGEQNPTYQVIKRLVPGYAREINKMKLTNVYPIIRIREEMAFPNCRECGELGPLIHLPTCDRLCWRCYYLDRSHWAIDLQLALDAFYLTQKDIEKFSNFVKPQGIVLCAEDEKPIKAMITVKCARQAGLEKHGSMLECEMLALDALVHHNYNDNDQVHRQYDRMCMALYETDTASDDFLADPENLDKTLINNPNKGIGIANFPYLPWKVKTPSKDCWYCRGCHYMSVFPFRMQTMHLEHLRLEDLHPRAYRPIITARSYMAYTWDEFIEHLDNCLGSALIMYDHAALCPDKSWSVFGDADSNERFRRWNDPDY